MKPYKLLNVAFLGILLTACATTGSTEPALVAEARQESPLARVDEVKQAMLSVLNSDTTVEMEEKKKISQLIEQGMQQFEQNTILVNQKKLLLVKEFMKNNPDPSKVEMLKKNIRKLHSAKMDELFKTFNEISKIVKVHPQSQKVFIERANLMWPMKDMN